MTEREQLMFLLRKGYSIEVGRLSICRIDRFYQGGIKGYQVHCDDYREQYSHIYRLSSLDEAVGTFLKLKRKLY